MAPRKRKIALTLDDVAEAKNAFKRDAPAKYKKMLDAQPDKTRVDLEQRKKPKAEDA
jgi:hypothetical protein